MARTSRMNCLAATLIVASFVSGCQSAGNKWSTAWKERTKPKANFQGVEGQEEVTYWPNKPAKSNSKLTGPSGQLKDKLVRKTEQSKRDAQLADLIKEGDQLRKNNQYEDARLVYMKAIDIAPDNPDIHHRLAIIADKQHQTELADKHYQAALRVRPRDPKLLNDMGYSYFLRGNMQLAEVTLKESLSLDRTNKIAMSNLGMIYAQQNRYPDALEMFRQGMSEADAQQSVAQLYHQNQSLASAGQAPNQGHSNASPLVTQAKADGSRDLSKLTFEQIQQEMARLRQEANQRRLQADQQMTEQARKLRADEERFQQQQMAQNNMNLQRGNLQGGPYITPGPQTADNAGPQGNQQGFGPAQGQQSMAPGSGSFSNGSMLYAGEPPLQMRNQVYSNGPPSQAMNGLPNDRAVNPGIAEPSLAGSAGGNQPARIFRGPSSAAQSYRPGDPQGQSGWDQRSQNGSPNNIPPSREISSASQLAIQLGMSAGPGSMFPVMQNQEANNAAMGNQPNQNWPVNSIEQRSNRGATNFGDEAQLPSIAPASPLNNWSSPATGGAVNWQQDSRSASDWSSETIPSNGQGSNGANQNNNRRLNGFDTLQPGLNPSQTRSDSEISRPYNGTWPNANSLPQQQNPNISINGRSPETLEIMGINPNSETGGSSPFSNGGSGSAQNPSSNSLPMYPYAPNR